MPRPRSDVAEEKCRALEAFVSPVFSTDPEAHLLMPTSSWKIFILGLSLALFSHWTCFLMVACCVLSRVFFFPRVFCSCTGVEPLLSYAPRVNFVYDLWCFSFWEYTEWCLSFPTSRYSSCVWFAMLMQKWHEFLKQFIRACWEPYAWVEVNFWPSITYDHQWDRGSGNLTEAAAAAAQPPEAGSLKVTKICLPGKEERKRAHKQKTNNDREWRTLWEQKSPWRKSA